MARRIFMASRDAEQGDERHCQDDVTPNVSGPFVYRTIRWHVSFDEPHGATEHEPGYDIKRID